MENNELAHYGVLGMKWGRRRYQNKDGTLTSAGQKRYERDQRENAGKKKGNKVGTADPNRWVREDLERSKKLSDASKSLTDSAGKLNDQLSKNSSRNAKRMDLSSMSDKEMRDRINREYLERQYNDMFSPQQKSKGREYASDVLATAGTVLGVTSSALGIALAIKELKG